MKEQDYLQCLSDSGMIGIVKWNLSGDVLEANETFLNIIGYSKNELSAGRINWKILTPVEYYEIDIVIVRELLTTGKSLCLRKKEYIRKDGSRIPVLSAGVLINREPKIGISFVLDMTEKEKAELLLRQNEEQFQSVFERSAVPEILVNLRI